MPRRWGMNTVEDRHLANVIVVSQLEDPSNLSVLATVMRGSCLMSTKGWKSKLGTGGPSVQYKSSMNQHKKWLLTEKLQKDNTKTATLLTQLLSLPNVEAKLADHTKQDELITVAAKRCKLGYGTEFMFICTPSELKSDTSKDLKNVFAPKSLVAHLKKAMVD